MDCIELNPKDNFSLWDTKYIKELHELEFTESLGNRLLFEDDNIRLWNLKLGIGERLPFMRNNKNYSWICETDAVLKSRFGNGRISLIRINKGETKYHQNAEKNYINDLENLTDTPALFKILEYKNKSLDLLPVLT